MPPTRRPPIFGALELTLFFLKTGQSFQPPCSFKLYHSDSGKGREPLECLSISKRRFVAAYLSSNIDERPRSSVPIFVFNNVWIHLDAYKWFLGLTELTGLFR